MALGRRQDAHQELWIATTDLPKSPGHVFYRKLNQVLAEIGFDLWLEDLCRPFYAEKKGRPSIPPGTYFRMILVGYFEGISSQRGIAWRCCDSRSLGEFLGYGPTEETPDHSSLTRVSQRLPLSVHVAMFQKVLAAAAEKGLLKGRSVAVDSTTLEANAAMKSIERRDTGENWNDYLLRLAGEAGLVNPTQEDLRRFDKSRSDKKVSNEEWFSPSDPDAKIARMKDGTTHLAYKAEHVIDLETQFVLAAEIYQANQADTHTLCDSVMTAQTNVNEIGAEEQIKEVAADKGYHSADALELANALDLRTYIPEPQRKKKDKKNKSKSESKSAGHERAVRNNRRRTGGDKGKRLQRERSEKVERSFAHVCETGGARRVWLRGLEKVRKRYLLQVCARNLGLMLRALFGMGTPRGLQNEGGAASEGCFGVIRLMQLAWFLLQGSPGRPLTILRHPEPASASPGLAA
jgi:transposase